MKAAPNDAESKAIGVPVLFLMAGITLSLVGLYIHRVAMGWAMWTMTHSNLWVASVALADLLTMLLVSGPAGALIDRSRPVVAYWVSQIASCAQGVVLLVLAESEALSPVAIVVCAALLGACSAFSLPARFSLIPMLVRREQYVSLVTLNSLGSNAAMFIGPMIGSWLMSSFGLNVALAANAAAYLPVIFVIPMVRTRAPNPVKPKRAAGLISQMTDGFVYILRNSEILFLLLAFSGLACTARGIMTLAPSIAAIVLHGDIETLAKLTSSVALGGIAGGLLTARRFSMPPKLSIIVTMAGGGLSLLAYGTLSNEIVALFGAFALGIMLSLNNISVVSAIQLTSEADFRGRVNSLYNIIFKGGPALGSSIFGCVAEFVSIQVSVAVASVLLLGMLALILSRMEKNDPLSKRPNYDTN